MRHHLVYDRVLPLPTCPCPPTCVCAPPHVSLPLPACLIAILLILLIAMLLILPVVILLIATLLILAIAILLILQIAILLVAILMIAILLILLINCRSANVVVQMAVVAQPNVGQVFKRRSTCLTTNQSIPEI